MLHDKTGTIRRILEEDGRCLVSFLEYESYFCVARELENVVRNAGDGQVMRFTHDTEMNIVAIDA